MADCRIPSTKAPAAGSIRAKFDLLEKWLLSNSRHIASVEQAVQSLAAFVPGQMQEAEGTSEAVAALLSVITIWKDDAAARKVPVKLAEQLENKPNEALNNSVALSPHGRHLAALYDSSSVYKAVAKLLELVRCVELLAEMLARSKGGQTRRWQIVVTVESIKASLRLILLGIAKRPLLPSLVHGTEFDSTEIEQLFNEEKKDQIDQDFEPSSAGTDTPGTTDMFEDTQWVMPRTRKRLASTPLDVKALLHSRILVPEKARSSLDLVRQGNAKILAGETIAVLRPMLYAYLCLMMSKKARTKRTKWLPWAVGLALELLSRKLSQQGLKELPGGLRQLSVVEQEIQTAKSKSLLWYLVRDPVYTSVARPLVDSLATKIQRVPLAGIAGVLVKDYLYLLDEYYFATASL